MPKILSQKSEYTARANPRRGYHDSETTVVFEDGTEEDQLQAMGEIQLELMKQNMWTGVPKRVGPNTWTINHGYDSGD